MRWTSPELWIKLRSSQYRRMRYIFAKKTIKKKRQYPQITIFFDGLWKGASSSSSLSARKNNIIYFLLPLKTILKENSALITLLPVQNLISPNLSIFC